MKVILVASHLKPTFGLEGAILLWANRMGPSIQPGIVALGDPTGRGMKRAPDGTPYRSMGYPLKGLRRAKSLIRTARLLRNAGPDVVVVAAGIWVAVPLLVVNLAFRRRVVVWEHSMDDGKMAHSRGLRVLAKAAAALYKYADQIVAVSDSLAASVELLTASRVAVIPNFVEAEVVPILLADEIDRGAVTRVDPTRRSVEVLAVGSLSPTKNYLTLIAAFKRLPVQWRLDIYGDGPQQSALSTAIAQLGSDGRVRLMGYVPAAQIPWARYDVFAHPSYGETFGYVLFEAAAAGLPVVVLDRGTMRDVVPHLVPGVLTEPDPDRLAQALEGVLENAPSAREVADARSRRRLYLSDERIEALWLACLTQAA